MKQRSHLVEVSSEQHGALEQRSELECDAPLLLLVLREQKTFLLSVEPLVLLVRLVLLVLVGLL